MVRLSILVAWSIVCAVALGVGLWSLVTLMPRLDRPSLADRVAPYLLDVSAGARESVARRSVDPLPVIGLLFAPLIREAGRILGGLLGGGEVIARRLAQSRSRISVERFRSEQVVAAVTGAVAGSAAVLALAAAAANPVTQAVVPLVSAGLGVLIRDLVLRRRAARRVARIESELPTVLEFLTLSLSAGETVLDALRRVARASSGELAQEFAIVIAEVNSGVPLVPALESRSRALAISSFSRCIEQLTAALERGTPLSEVLRAQAQDAREDAKRELLELAGKKEVTMLIPLVFLILPTTVIFAIFPGVVVLQTAF